MGRKTKPVIQQFVEATYTITSNSEDYELLTDVRNYYETFCASIGTTPMDRNLFLTILLQKYPALELTTLVINEEETAVLTHIAPI